MASNGYSNENREYLRNREKQAEEDMNKGVDKAPEVVRVVKEKKRFQQVKDTLEFFRDHKRFRRAEIPQGAVEIAHLSEEESQRNQSELHWIRNREISVQSLTMRKLLFLGLTIAIIVCSFCSWYQINGREVNLLNVMEYADNLNSFVGGSGDLESFSNTLRFFCILIWGGAAIYIWLAVQIFADKQSQLPYVGAIYEVLVLCISLVKIQSVNSGVEDAFWGYSVIRIELTFAAKVTIAISVLLGILYYNREKLLPESVRAFQNAMMDNQVGTFVKSFPITNYYPWENITLTTLILEKTRTAKVKFQYVYKGMNTCSFVKEKRNDKILLVVDVVFKDNGGTCFVAKNIDITIDHLEQQGETRWNSGLLMDMNLIKRIEDVKVLIKQINIAGVNDRGDYKVYIDSRINSEELNSYRRHIKYNAVCEKEIISEGWICPCGLYHDLEEEVCMHCYMAR